MGLSSSSLKLSSLDTASDMICKQAIVYNAQTIAIPTLVYYTGSAILTTVSPIQTIIVFSAKTASKLILIIQGHVERHSAWDGEKMVHAWSASRPTA